MCSAKLHPIRVAREAANLTQQEVADRVGVGKAAISRWETSVDLPEPRNARRLMRLLPELSFDDIYPPMEEAA